MRTTNLVLAAVVTGVLLGTTACGGGTVTIRPADAPGSAAATPAAGATPTAGDRAGFTIGSDGSVKVSDGAGAGYSVGSDGSVKVDDGAGNTISVGGDGSVDVSAVSPVALDGAPDIAAFCTQATRYGIAFADAQEQLAKPASGDADRFATSMATMVDATDKMRGSGPPALEPDLDALAARDSAIAALLVTNGRDLERLAADPSLAAIDSAGQRAFIRVGVTTAAACP